MPAASAKVPPPPRSEVTKHQISYRFPQSLIDAIEAYAEREDVSKNTAVEHLLAWALTQAGVPPKE